MVDIREDIVTGFCVMCDIMASSTLSQKTDPKLQYCVGRELLLLGTLAYRHRSFLMVDIREDIVTGFLMSPI